MATKATYKRLGDYIQLVDVRNQDLKVEKLVGLTIDKSFIPSVANVIGTDLSNYKIIKFEQFACSLMQVSRDGKMPIAMCGEDSAIMSPAYPMFEVIDKSILMPEYLMMWFSRSEFDREASFYAVGGVRGSLTWDDFCDMTLPIPSVEEQRKIVDEYQTLVKRIEINNQLIAKLEDTAQAIYRNMFVDGIDKENLPEGWKMGTLTDIGIYTNGIACQNYETNNDESLPVLKIRELSQGKFDLDSDRASLDVPKELIIEDGDLIFSWSASLIVDFWCGGKGVLNQHLFKVTSEKVSKWYLYLATKSHVEEWKRMISAKATSMGHIKREDLDSAVVVIPANKDLKKFDTNVSSVFTMMLNTKKEILKLYELQSLLLAKMGQ